VFPLLVGGLTALAVAPFFRTHLLPLQDYPQMLLLARAFGDATDPSSPFHGAYERGFLLAPLLLPILLLRALGAFLGLEGAGRLLWAAYVGGLVLATLRLLRVLGRARWAALLLFPIVLSYWVAGGCFAYATAAPLVVLGLSIGVEHLDVPTRGRAIALGAVACALHLWHSIALAELGLAFGVLWLLRRFPSHRARALAVAPFAPAFALFVAWLAISPRGTAGGGANVWPTFQESAPRFLDTIGPITPEAGGATMLFALVLAAGAAMRPASGPGEDGGYRVASPFAWVALVAAAYFVLPTSVRGVEGIANRLPWFAALMLVFGYGLPTAPRLRPAFLAAVAVLGGFDLVALGRRFAAFDAETIGASRLLDRVGPRESVLAPLQKYATAAFPSPARPLAGVDLYASVRHGGLPDSSFAGYPMNLVRYVDGKNPMPGIGVHLTTRAGLERFAWVLYRGDRPIGALHPSIEPFADDGEWHLGKVRPAPPPAP
jgi:hypothetical protein